MVAIFKIIGKKIYKVFWQKPIGIEGTVRGSERLITIILASSCQGHWFNCLHFSPGLIRQPLSQMSLCFFYPDVILPLSFCWSDLLKARIQSTHALGKVQVPSRAHRTLQNRAPPTSPSSSPPQFISCPLCSCLIASLTICFPDSALQ